MRGDPDRVPDPRARLAYLPDPLAVAEDGEHRATVGLGLEGGTGAEVLGHHKVEAFGFTALLRFHLLKMGGV